MFYFNYIVELNDSLNLLSNEYQPTMIDDSEELGKKFFKKYSIVLYVDFRIKNGRYCQSSYGEFLSK
jgi:hypothetical protein